MWYNLSTLFVIGGIKMQRLLITMLFLGGLSWTILGLVKEYEEERIHQRFKKMDDKVQQSVRKVLNDS